MKYLIRTAKHWLESGYIEWSPGRDRWYPLSQVNIYPERTRKDLIKIFSFIHQKRSIAVEGYYDQRQKMLVINKILSMKERLSGFVEEDIVMFLEEVEALDLI